MATVIAWGCWIAGCFIFGSSMAPGRPWEQTYVAVGLMIAAAIATNSPHYLK